MNQDQEINFQVDQQNLYREESMTDLKVAVIRKLIPIKADGSDDQSRSPIFVGHSQVMSPEGLIPLQAELAAANLEDAINDFPRAMDKAMVDMVDQIKQMQREQQQQESRIITPGR